MLEWLNFGSGLERNQSKRVLVESFLGGFFFHPSDEDLSLGTPEKKKPLGGFAFGVHLLWFRCSFRVADKPGTDPQLS
jgi:hypothetical protein